MSGESKSYVNDPEAEPGVRRSGGSAVRAAARSAKTRSGRVLHQGRVFLLNV